MTSSATAKANSSVQVSVRVTNTGKMDGEEVVQLYLRRQVPGYRTPIRALKGFQRIPLKRGESKVVTFNLRPQDLTVIDEKGNARHVPGAVQVSVGGSQPDAASKKSKKTVEGTLALQ